jgi:hypothetical protein
MFEADVEHDSSSTASCADTLRLDQLPINGLPASWFAQCRPSTLCISLTHGVGLNMQSSVLVEFPKAAKST